MSEWGAAFKSFCNFPKQTSVIGQLCGGVKVGWVWTSLSSSLFSFFTQPLLLLFMWTAECNTINALLSSFIQQLIMAMTTINTFAIRRGQVGVFQLYLRLWKNLLGDTVWLTCQTATSNQQVQDLMENHPAFLLTRHTDWKQHYVQKNKNKTKTKVLVKKWNLIHECWFE